MSHSSALADRPRSAELVAALIFGAAVLTVAVDARALNLAIWVLN
ncbi:MAG: hypothetical protein WB767_08770 [Nocardioides sp.]